MSHSDRCTKPTTFHFMSPLPMGVRMFAESPSGRAWWQFWRPKTVRREVVEGGAVVAGERLYLEREPWRAAGEAELVRMAMRLRLRGTADL